LELLDPPPGERRSGEILLPAPPLAEPTGVL